MLREAQMHLRFIRRIMPSISSWNTKRTDQWYRHWLLWTLLVLIAVFFFGWSRAKSRYQRWNAGRQTRRASDFLAQGDFQHAFLEAMLALQTNPMDAGAMRIMAQGLEAADAAPTAAMWRSRLDTLEPGNMENILAWASDSLKAGDHAAAERILAMVKPEAQNNAGYHATAAAIAMAKRDTVGAEQHWAEASRLDPQEDRYRLPLATIRLKSKNADLRTDALTILTEISRKPLKNVAALRILLTDAINQREWPRAEDFANELVAAPGAAFEDKLTRLDALRAMKSLESVGYLTQLREEAISNPKQFYLLLMWMNQNDLALMVSDWARTLPPDVLGASPICVAIADAYVRSSEWTRLREYADERTWGDMDYLRRAFLARALERLDEGDASAQQWKDALSAARGRDDRQQRLERMARLAVTWRWEKRAEEVMWMLTGFPTCPRWVLDGLWAVCLERADTAQLQKLAGILSKADSKSADLRNNYAFFSLLTRSEEGNPHHEAERLFTENPGNATVAVTWGLSLYQRGKIAEALAVTASLPSGELKKPQIALYHAIFLTAAGEATKGAEFLSVAQDWKMFAEEKALLERAKLTVARAADERGVAEAAKVARDARAARDAEADKAVEIARAARAAQAAEDAAQAPSAAR